MKNTEDRSGATNKNTMVVVLLTLIGLGVGYVLGLTFSPASGVDISTTQTGDTLKLPAAIEDIADLSFSVVGTVQNVSETELTVASQRISSGENGAVYTFEVHSDVEVQQVVSNEPDAEATQANYEAVQERAAVDVLVALTEDNTFEVVSIIIFPELEE